MKRFTYFLHAIVLVILVLIDQISKYFVRGYVKGNPVSVWEGVFSLYYHENRGSVWGILQGKVDFLLIVSIFLFVVLIYVYVRMPKQKQYASLLWIDVFLLAGALGNTIDRLFLGYVTDFLYFELINFPIFNIADCYITVCAFLTIILAVTKYKDDDFAFLSLKRKEMPDADTKSDEI
ncbi:MAG: signal peptidase II [Lachnospiraceae bacterium]|nr:signal peptidase II [Lachnospiraceae bacterium]